MHFTGTKSLPYIDSPLRVINIEMHEKVLIPILKEIREICTKNAVKDLRTLVKGA